MKLNDKAQAPVSKRGIDFEALWRLTPQGFALGVHSDHGPKHWRRVEQFGLRIAAETEGVDTDIVRLFAVFHDCRRENEYDDPGHGARGAAYAFDVYKQMFPQLGPADFERLVFACCWHTHVVHHEEVTIGACFDADRLDLGRVGIRPEAQYLNTEAAKRMV